MGAVFKLGVFREPTNRNHASPCTRAVGCRVWSGDSRAILLVARRRNSS